MIKVGIITYHFVVNYGAAMQAWALQEYLSKNGYLPKIIDYQPDHIANGGKIIFPTSLHQLKVMAFRLLLKIRALLLLLSKYENKKKQKFFEFHRSYFFLTEKKYKTIQSLNESEHDFDVFICGSDQIWNSSRQAGIDEAYFLNFAPKDAKKVSYAASFGRSNFDKANAKKLSRLISSFHSISVREPSGVRLVAELTNRKAEYVLDPTLLLGEKYIKTVMPSNLNKSYIFSYLLRSKEVATRTNKYISNKIDLELVSHETLKAQGNALSPFEWVGYFKYAEYIVTNSYHGTLFSLIFNKPFIFVALNGKKSTYNERSLSLLNQISLDRLVLFSYNEADIDRILKEEIDWDKINKQLDSMRLKSAEYLKVSLAR